MVANRTAKAVGPTQLHQVVATRVLGGEAGLEFDQIARVILHSAVYYILGLPESSGYPTRPDSGGNPPQPRILHLVVT